MTLRKKDIQRMTWTITLKLQPHLFEKTYHSNSTYIPCCNIKVVSASFCIGFLILPIYVLFYIIFIYLNVVLLNNKDQVRASEDYAFNNSLVASM